MKRLLTVVGDETYLFSLSRLGYAIEAVDSIPGRVISPWDERRRPLPGNLQLVSLEEIREGNHYVGAIAHSIPDLMALRELSVPRILLLHLTLERSLRDSDLPFGRDRMCQAVSAYLTQIGAVAVAASGPILASWRTAGQIIPPTVDADDYGGYTGELPIGLRLADQVSANLRRLAWSKHEALVDGFPWRLVGSNPDRAGAERTRNWDHLKSLLRTHRFFIHTASRGSEEGHDLALLEAMATGMPVVSTASPNSPVSDGISGFVSDDIGHLKDGIRRLLADRELAVRMGQEARNTVLQDFSQKRFLRAWQEALEAAKDGWARASAGG